jgi:hypothetical protein
MENVSVGAKVTGSRSTGTLARSTLREDTTPKVYFSFQVLPGMSVWRLCLLSFIKQFQLLSSNLCDRPS